MLEYEIAIAAPARAVWELLTTAEGLDRWIGSEATAEAVPGGELRWTDPEASAVVGRFVQLVPHERVAFTYGWEDGRMGVSPESTTVEIDLREREGITHLRLAHRGLPPEAVEAHEQDWAYFLGRLAALPSEVDPMQCPRCETELEYVGTKRFHEGTRAWGFALGDFGELFVNREHFDIYVCPRCGRVELFVDGIGEEFRPR